MSSLTEDYIHLGQCFSEYSEGTESDTIWLAQPLTTSVPAGQPELTNQDAIWLAQPFQEHSAADGIDVAITDAIWLVQPLTLLLEAGTPPDPPATGHIKRMMGIDIAHVKWFAGISGAKIKAAAGIVN